MLVPSGVEVSLKVIHQGNENVVDGATTTLIGSDASATVRIVRPGISRRHAVISFDGATWKIEDAGSRNGTFKDGKRIQTLAIEGPTTLYLGHPTDGEAVSLVPIALERLSGSDSVGSDSVEAPFDLPPAPPVVAPASEPATRRQGTSSSPKPHAGQTVIQPSTGTTSTDIELAQLTAAIRDQISAVKGLTWSVWAMIAVTAALIVLTLFVGILSN